MSRLKDFRKECRLNHVFWEVRSNPDLRARWQTDFDGLARDYGLSEAEIRAVKGEDLKELRRLGVHQFYLLPIIRVTRGEDYATHLPYAVAALKRAYGPPEAVSSTDDKTKEKNHG